eukprot:164719_1
MEDINQHFEQLRRLLVKLGYPHPVDKERICAGITTELLPLLHFGLLSHSKPLASFLLESGYDLYKKNDFRFTEGIYKLLRNEFKYNPILQCNQFLTDKGFAKRKIQFVVKCLQLGMKKHSELTKLQKLKTQSKVAWNKTNLAKKVENIIKNNNNNNKKSEPIQTRIIKKKIHKSKPIKEQKQNINTQQTNINNINNIMNDSLNIDEIRNDLPQPIIIQTKSKSISTELNDSDNDNQSGNEHEYHEKEEKAMEISNEQLYEQDDNDNDNNNNNDNESEEDADKSIQIPQYTYDMNLIPEYDPNKYMHNIGNDIETKA